MNQWKGSPAPMRLMDRTPITRELKAAAKKYGPTSATIITRHALLQLGRRAADPFPECTPEQVQAATSDEFWALVNAGTIRTITGPAGPLYGR